MKAVPNARVRVEKSNLQLEVCGEYVASTNLNQFKIFFGSAILVRFPDFPVQQQNITDMEQIVWPPTEAITSHQRIESHEV